ncbi:MAG: hypothetical protein ACRELZ_05020 [Candidatus Rokuibacteriota bacterium]
MQRRNYLRALTIGLCGILAAAGAVAAQTSSGTTDKIKGYTVEKKTEAVALGKKAMSDFDAQVKDLEGQIAKDTSSAKADAQRQLKDLKAQQAATGKKLDDLGKASKDTWDTTKHGFADAFSDLQKSYDKVKASVKK